jgi:tagatose-1,6-bisphosphate aldolase
LGTKSTVPSSISSSSSRAIGARPRLGVAHRRGAVAVAAAEVALAVDQRVALREVLRHAHQRVVGRLVAVRVEAAEHVADHARALHRLGPAAVVKASPMRSIA